jgi:DNA-binding CsgD family transcriptional regulator
MHGTDIADNPQEKTKRAPRGVQPKKQASRTRLQCAARRKIIANALLDGKTTMEAGLLAGLSPRTADNQVSQILSEPKTQNTLLAAMVAHGMDDAYFANHHKQLIEGTKVISANIIVPGSGTDLKDAGSMTKDFIEVPDFQAKAKGLDMAYKLQGRYIDKKEIDITQPITFITKDFYMDENGEVKEKSHVA